MHTHNAYQAVLPPCIQYKKIKILSLFLVPEVAWWWNHMNNANIFFQPQIQIVIQPEKNMTDDAAANITFPVFSAVFSA